MSAILLYPRRLRIASATHFHLAQELRSRATAAINRGDYEAAKKALEWAEEHEERGDAALELEMAWSIEMRRRAG